MKCLLQAVDSSAAMLTANTSGGVGPGREFDQLQQRFFSEVPRALEVSHVIMAARLISSLVLGTFIWSS